MFTKKRWKVVVDSVNYKVDFIYNHFTYKRTILVNSCVVFQSKKQVINPRFCYILKIGKKKFIIEVKQTIWRIKCFFYPYKKNHVTNDFELNLLPSLNARRMRILLFYLFYFLAFFLPFYKNNNKLNNTEFIIAVSFVTIVFLLLNMSVIYILKEKRFLNIDAVFCTDWKLNLKKYLWTDMSEIRVRKIVGDTLLWTIKTKDGVVFNFWVHPKYRDILDIIKLKTVNHSNIIFCVEGVNEY